MTYLKEMFKELEKATDTGSNYPDWLNFRWKLQQLVSNLELKNIFDIYKELFSIGVNKEAKKTRLLSYFYLRALMELEKQARQIRINIEKRDLGYIEKTVLDYDIEKIPDVLNQGLPFAFENRIYEGWRLGFICKTSKSWWNEARSSWEVK